MKRSDGQIVAFVTALVAAAQLSTSIYLPSMPAMTAEFTTSAATMQLTFTAYMLGAAVSQLVIGPLSDRFGRRPVLLAGLVVYAGATFAAAFSPSIEALIGWRLLQSIGATTGPVIGRAVVRDCFDRARGAQVMANVGLALAISPALAPLVGALVHAAAGWRANFVLIGLFGVALLLVTLRWFAETNRQRQAGAGPARLARNYLWLLRSPSFLGYALCSSLMFGGMFAFFSEGPFVFIEVLKTSPTGYALYSAFTVIGFAVGSYVTGRTTLRLGIDTMMLLGIGAALLGAALLVGLAIAGVATPFAIVLPITVFVFGIALVFPNGTAGALGVAPAIAGTASALLGFLQLGMAGLATFAVGQLSDGTVMPMASVIALGGGLGSLSFALRFIGRSAAGIDGAAEQPE